MSDAVDKRDLMVTFFDQDNEEPIKFRVNVPSEPFDLGNFVYLYCRGKAEEMYISSCSGGEEGEIHIWCLDYLEDLKEKENDGIISKDTVIDLLYRWYFSCCRYELI